MSRPWVLALALWAAGCDFGGAIDRCVAEGRCIDTDAGEGDGGTIGTIHPARRGALARRPAAIPARRQP